MSKNAIVDDLSAAIAALEEEAIKRGYHEEDVASILSSLRRSKDTIAAALNDDDDDEFDDEDEFAGWRDFNYGKKWDRFIESSPLPGYEGHYHSAVRVAARFRRQVPRMRNLLFHGTPAPKAVLKSGVLLPGNRGNVCFTRDFAIATHYALLAHDDPEHVSAVLVFDRDLMRLRGVAFQPHYEDGWDENRHDGGGLSEELIPRCPGFPLRPFLIGVITISPDEDRQS